MLRATYALAQKRLSRHARSLVVVSAALLLTLALAACGVSATSGGDVGIGGAATPTATSAASGLGTSVKPCPIVGTSVNIGSPALVLTPQSASQQATAHVGDAIVVELPATTRWQMSQLADTTLRPTDPQGALDDGLHACVWSFHAQSPGTATLNFAGSALCEGGQACAPFNIALSFTIKVE